MSEARIRPGRREDLPAVHALVQELALFERAPQEVKTSAAEFERDAYAEHPAFDFLVAEDAAGSIVGMALFCFPYSTWQGRILYLDDLVVTESWRGRGIGRRLLEATLERARAEGVRQCRWQVLEWNQPAIDLYQKIGAELDPEWINCKLRLG
jgi:GNAT superfamily N-acetyltransferase